MTYYDEKLRVLQKRVQRKAYLKPRVEELKKQKKELEPKLKVLEIYAHNESIDVENLENKTLTSIFYDIIGKKEEKLEKERAEANEWIIKRDTAKRELEDVENELESGERELASLVNCEEEYMDMLDKRLDLIRKTDIVDVDYRAILLEKISFCDNKIQKINEACEIIENAVNILNETIDELNSAERWGEFDMFGRGKIADIKKYDHIGNAETLLFNLKKEISKLKIQIEDINIVVDIDVGLSEFSDTSDWIFDNIFTASNFLDNVDASKQSVRKAIEQIKCIKTSLENIRAEKITERTNLQIEYNALK